MSALGRSWPQWVDSCRLASGRFGWKAATTFASAISGNEGRRAVIAWRRKARPNVLRVLDRDFRPRFVVAGRNGCAELFGKRVHDASAKARRSRAITLAYANSVVLDSERLTFSLRSIVNRD